MSLFPQVVAQQVAKDLIMEGLKSGSIKLVGSGSSNFAEINANNDATYLSTLLTKLTTQITNGAAPP